jgi:GntR family transcriptional regulator
VETRPGQGTFVVQKIVPFLNTLTGDPGAGSDGDIYLNEVRATLRAGDVSPPRVEIQQVGSSLAEELQADEGSTVVSRHQERRIDGTPWSLQTSFYPLSLVQRGATRLIDAKDIQQGSVEYLRESVGTGTP